MIADAHAAPMVMDPIVPRTPTATRYRRWVGTLIVVVEYLLLAAGLCYLGGRTIPRAWQKLNTDFPNYYLTARLLREGYNTDRIYEWTWIQRQKDRLGIDQPVVGFAPNTPFASLAVLPLTYLAPLTAKRTWIALNLLMLAAVAALLHSLTGMLWRRIALLMVLCFPLHRNLLYGQYYILLLLVSTLALWAYVRGQRAAAGLLVGLGCGLKVFPVLLILYFLRKKDYKAAIALVAGTIATVIASILAFGVGLHRTYFVQVLPWALRGEGMDPYNLASNSLSALLHHLLVFEPEWNPHPLLHAPALLAVLNPLLQLLILAPAILLIAPREVRPRHLGLEWSSFLIGLLAISTMPASYHFALLILPVVLIAGALIQDERYLSLGLLLILYFGVCFPLWRTDLGVPALDLPRLYLVLLLALFSYSLLLRPESPGSAARRDRWIWVGALACALILEVAATLHHQRGVYSSYPNRVMTSPNIIMATEPQVHNGSLHFVTMSVDGYRTGVRTRSSFSLDESNIDRLALTGVASRQWVEEAGRQSKVVLVGSGQTPDRLEIENAEYPVVSGDAKKLAYLRSVKGESRIWIRDLQNSEPDRPMSPPGLNVFEMSFLPGGTMVFAASRDHGAPHLFVTDANAGLGQISEDEARYPSASPDGNWLAYSQLQGGTWNLWLKDMRSGAARRITTAECNDIFPAWEADSKTLVYASDCGRAFGLTALNRLRVIP